MPPLRRARPAAVLVFAGAATAAPAACSSGESRPVNPLAAADAPPAGRASDRSVARGDRVRLAGDVAPPDVRPTRPAYRAGAVANAGAVSGALLLDGPPPRDSAYATAPGDRGVCGATAAGPAVDLSAGPAGPGLRGAVVWLEGVPAGKPLPETRRYELALRGCRLVPAHLAAAVGGALNVHGVDPVASRLRLARLAPAGDPDAGRVLLRTAMSDAGQVVPDAQVLAAAGAADVAEESGTRPWLRAWVLAFDHPYFAATADGGAFSFADVPPGTYRVVAWHGRLGRASAPVTVAPGQTAAVTLRLGGR